MKLWVERKIMLDLRKKLPYFQNNQAVEQAAHTYRGVSFIGGFQEEAE